MRKYFLPIALVFLLGLVISCEKASMTPVSVPNIVLDCQLSACNASATALNSTALVLLSKSGCQNDFEVPASATPTLACNASGCTGVASAWVDSNSNSVTEILSGSYDLCILIDVDNSGNTSYTTGDIVFEKSVNISSGGTITADGSAWEVVN